MNSETTNNRDTLLVTEPEAAKMLSLSLSKLEKMARAGEIEFVKIGKSKRYSVEVLREFISRHTQRRGE